MEGLEKIYREHNTKRGEGFAILAQERGSFLRKHIQSGKKVLDIGCRDGQLTSQYMKGNNVTGADVDSVALEYARKNFGIETIHADLNKDWPFEEGAYDVVVSCEFLEHIYFPDKIIEKIENLLKPNGIFVGTVPHAYSLQSRIKFLLGIQTGTPLEDPTHINHFTYKYFKDILEKHFDIIEIDTYIPPRYRFLSIVFPYLFAHDLMFAVQKRSS